jgi:hypothetical protein
MVALDNAIGDVDIAQTELVRACLRFGDHNKAIDDLIHSLGELFDLLGLRLRARPQGMQALAAPTQRCYAEELHRMCELILAAIRACDPASAATGHPSPRFAGHHYIWLIRMAVHNQGAAPLFSVIRADNNVALTELPWAKTTPSGLTPELRRCARHAPLRRLSHTPAAQLVSIYLGAERDGNRDAPFDPRRRRYNAHGRWCDTGLRRRARPV